MSLLMKLKLKGTLLISKLVIKLCRLFHLGGTSYAGELARKLYPPILKELAKPFRIILVTGTNGKTTTTKIIGKILEENDIEYITNKSGANLVDGITTLFIEKVHMNLTCPAKTALIEIDEAALKRLADHVTPEILVVTNFFRDQLDRYGELTNTVKGVRNTIERFPELTTVINADDSLSCSLVKDRDKDKIIYYDFAPSVQDSPDNISNADATYCIYCKSKYTYTSVSYGHLGNFKCENCGFEKPATNISVTDISSTDFSSDIKFTMDEEEYSAKVNLPGLYNIYNSLAAISCAKAFGLPVENSIKAIGSFESSFGRMEKINAGDKTITLILVKNPNSFNQTIRLLNSKTEDINLVFALNDKIADGTDVSWIWDIDFEILSDNNHIQNVYTCGTRGYEMAMRMKYAGIDEAKTSTYDSYSKLIDDIVGGLPAGSDIYILPTYTAMLEVRSVLKKKFNLKEFWK